jgi:uncharacterized protein
VATRWADWYARARHDLDQARASAAAGRQDVVAVGYFGSYARGDASFGSDLDLLVVRRHGASVPDLLGADVAALPVPADIVHYTASELRAVLESGTRMAAVIEREARWWVGGPGTPAPPAPGPSP